MKETPTLYEVGRALKLVSEYPSVTWTEDSTGLTIRVPRETMREMAAVVEERLCQEHQAQEWGRAQ